MNHIPEHVILAAFSVEAATREEAHAALQRRLPRPLAREREETITGEPSNLNITSPVTSWWIAEDDRRDGSDNDSAVFVHPGMQQNAAAVLHTLGMTGRCNLLPTRDTGAFEATRPAAEEVATMDDAMAVAYAAMKARDEALTGLTVACARVIAARIREVFPDAKEALLEFPEWSANWSIQNAEGEWDTIGSTGEEEDEARIEQLDALADDLGGYTPREWDEQPWMLRDYAGQDGDGLDICRHSGGLNRAVLNLDAMLGQKAPIAPSTDPTIAALTTIDSVLDDVAALVKATV